MFSGIPDDFSGAPVRSLRRKVKLLKATLKRWKPLEFS